MFIKKDNRKIPRILSDATSRAVAAPSSANPAEDDGEGVISEMKFARRAPEFLPSCNASILLEPTYRPALDNLMQLSLYDCGLRSLAGIEEPDADRFRAPLFPRLDQLDLGRNPDLTNGALPETFHTQFPRLSQLWLDDCGFGPNVPATLLEMSELRVVRMTGNELEGELEDGIGVRYWMHLRVLALDGNRLNSVGRGIGRMKSLAKLHLRGNNLRSLPEGVPGENNSSLILLGLSSNKVASLPSSLVDAMSLKELYLNGNDIEELPDGLAKLVALKKLNLAHNSIGKGSKAAAGTQNSTGASDEDVVMEIGDGDEIPLPHDFIERFGMPEPLTGNCTKDECIVRLEGNPYAESIRKTYLEEEKRKAKEMETEA